MRLTDLNDMHRDDFLTALGWIFEHSPWVAERAWAARPFPTVDALHAALVAQVEAATRDEQLALLRAHPDLGTRARMSTASQTEQSGAGLHSLTPDDLARLAAYRNHFGFPFLYAVKGSTTTDIRRALDRRSHNSPDDEFQEALRQVYRIGRFRLESISAET